MISSAVCFWRTFSPSKREHDAGSDGGRVRVYAANDPGGHPPAIVTQADPGTYDVTVTVKDEQGFYSLSSQPLTVTIAEAVVGDLNCDGEVDFGDINPFILALTSWGGYQQHYPNCDIMLADINGDGFVTFADINPFVALFAGG